MHDDFALTTDRSKVEDIHIIKKEPNIANYIIDYGYLQSEQCVDHQKHRIKKTWLVCKFIFKQIDIHVLL